MGSLIGSLIGLCIIPAVITWVTWNISAKNKHRKLITVATFLACFVVAGFIKGFWQNLFTIPDTSTPVTQASEETTETPTETEEKPKYAKIGDLKIDITSLGYERVKSAGDFRFTDYSEDEKERLWKDSNLESATKNKVWQDFVGGYILTLSEYNDRIITDLDDFAKGVESESDGKSSGSHIDIDGVHAYKLLENEEDGEWGQVEIALIYDNIFYIISIYSPYVGGTIDVEDEADSILQHTTIIK